MMRLAGGRVISARYRRANVFHLVDVIGLARAQDTSSALGASSGSQTSK
jgi:hypothetical protein